MRQQSDPAHVVMPGVHRVASLLQRLLLGTHQGSVDEERLLAYLNEFVRHEALSDRVGCKAHRGAAAAVW